RHSDDAYSLAGGDIVIDLEIEVLPGRGELLEECSDVVPSVDGHCVREHRWRVPDDVLVENSDDGGYVAAPECLVRTPQQVGVFVRHVSPRVGGVRGLVTVADPRSTGLAGPFDQSDHFNR